MMTKRWRQVEDLFHSALDRAPDDRSAFFDEACADDRALREQVEGLLESFDEAGDFIEKPLMDELLSSRARAPTPSESIIGRKLGNYEIQSLIGAGGMGEVYLARDARLGRQIALKLLPAQFTSDLAQVQRFEREARAASALNHPNIITIYEVGQEGDAHFIATEYIAGRTLRELIAEGKLQLRENLAIAVQIASALAAAHAAGIVHRDIKPENVMVRTDGLVKLLDFGLAKPVKSETTTGNLQKPGAASLQSDPRMLMGTLAYLSPEQARGEEVDLRTDIFSLGVVLYEMVTGVRPFTGDSPASISDAILHRAPASFSRERPEAPLALQRIINRALEKDCAARYQTAGELGDDLQQLARESNNLGAWYSGWRVKAALGLSALLMLAVLLAVALRRQSPKASVFAVRSVKRITDIGGQEVFPSLSPDGQFIVYASRASGNWDIYRQKIGERHAVNLTAQDTHFDFTPALSPDGSLIAFLSSRTGHGIHLMDRNGQNIRRISPDGYNPAWSPDGQEIALADDWIFNYEDRVHNQHSRIFAVNVQTGAQRLITSGDAVQPNWSPHGHRIAYWGVHQGGWRDIWTVSAAGGEPVAVTNDRAVDWNPVWSRDGKYLYFLSDRGGSMNLWRVPIDELSGRVAGSPEPTTLPSVNSQHLSFSADGRAIVYVEMSRRENAWQVALDPVTASIAGQPAQITYGVRRYSSPQPSPDGKSLVFVSMGESQEDVSVLVLGGSVPRQLTNDPAQELTPRWSPDGQKIAFLSNRSGKNEIWKINQDGSGLEQLTDMPGADVLYPVWSPNGQRLLYGVRGVNSYIIKPSQPRTARTPQPLAGQPIPGFTPSSWSPDGKLLAGWNFKPEQPDGGVVIYSFATHRYEKLTDFGWNPIWMNDNRRLFFVRGGNMYVLDILTKEWRKFHSIEPNEFWGRALSQDNRRLYYSAISTEADIWLMNMK